MGRTKAMRIRVKIRVFMVFAFLLCDGDCIWGSPVVG